MMHSYSWETDSQTAGQERSLPTRVPVYYQVRKRRSLDHIVRQIIQSIHSDHILDKYQYCLYIILGLLKLTTVV
jgi:hypothetical protein